MTSRVITAIVLAWTVAHFASAVIGYPPMVIVLLCALLLGSLLVVTK